MITEQDLRQAIAECQGERNPNASTCIKLAAYYTILDHTIQTNVIDTGDKGDKGDTGYSMAAYSSDSEFAQLANRMSYGDVMSVMDELMDALRVLNPRLYDGVIRNMEDRA